MIVKNFVKILDDKIKKESYIKIKTWNIMSGFQTWNIDDKEIQHAKVQNFVYYEQCKEFEIQAQL